MRKTKKPYAERDDLEKLKSQWNKLSGLLERGEWSAAIIRAATAAEITANIAIRKSFKEKSQFEPEFVNSMLRWANGLAGKIDRLLMPMADTSEWLKELKGLKKTAEKINTTRNAVVHQGEFANQKKANETFELSKKFIESLLSHYEPDLTLKDILMSSSDIGDCAENSKLQKHKRKATRE